MAETTLNNIAAAPLIPAAAPTTTPPPTDGHIYFPGLNGIRALAALSVVFRHMETLKIWYGVDHDPYFILYQISLTGSDAVSLFFVLSGFLITYLLLTEQGRTGTIRVRQFYARRALRIWPLYYFMLFLAFIVLPWFESITGKPSPFAPGLEPHLLLLKLREYVLFVPHFAHHFNRIVSGITHLWTIGVEEHFYLLWPAVLKKLSPFLVPICIVIIIFKWIIIPLPLADYYGTLPQWWKDLSGILILFRIDNMAVGALGAYVLYYRKERILRFIYHPIVEKVTLLIIVALVVFWTWDYYYLRKFFVAVPFIIFILNVCSNPRSTVKMENPVFNMLGRISYGIYMYHLVVMHIVLRLLSYTPLNDGTNFFYNLLVYGLCAGITIGISYLSYEKFEKIFLRFKPRFAVVQSGEQQAAVPKTT